jgi:hypothetical protein
VVGFFVFQASSHFKCTTVSVKGDWLQQFRERPLGVQQWQDCLRPHLVIQEVVEKSGNRSLQGGRGNLLH